MNLASEESTEQCAARPGARHALPYLRPLLPALQALALALAVSGCAQLSPLPPAPVTAEPPAPVAQAEPATIEPAAAMPAPEALPEVDGAPVIRKPIDSGPGSEPVPGLGEPGGDLWERVRSGYRIPDLDNDLVLKWETWYGSRPDYVQRVTERGGRYLFHIVEEIERRGMPTDLALLPFIESAFNPQALSRVRASGMWQFMPATGKDFELRQNLFRDDRRDVLASTRAALDYLQRLHARFGDWHLALAAYNWGQGNVQRAIERNARAGLGTAYTDLRMPDETRNYVPKLQAVKNIIAQPERFSLALPPLANHPYFLSVPIERDIDVALAARLAGLPLAEFQLLNPQMNKPVILAAGTPLVLLPYDNANQFLRSLEQHQGPLASWTAWVAPRNIRPTEAAKLVGMPEARLREVNRIPPRMMVKKGSTLLVPRAANSVQDVASHIADHASIALAPDAPEQRRTTTRVRKGESLALVARRQGVSTQNLARWNGLATNARLREGQHLVVMRPARQPAAATRTAGTASAGNKTAARPAATAQTARAQAAKAAPRSANAQRSAAAQAPRANAQQTRQAARAGTRQAQAKPPAQRARQETKAASRAQAPRPAARSQAATPAAKRTSTQAQPGTRAPSGQREARSAAEAGAS